MARGPPGGAALYIPLGLGHSMPHSPATSGKETPMSDASDKNRPAHKVYGSPGSGLTVTLWKHDSDNGPWYTATPNRRHNQDAQWDDSNSYSQQDFLELAELFCEAHAW